MKIQTVVDEAYSNLVNQDIDTFGKLLEYTWEMKKPVLLLRGAKKPLFQEKINQTRQIRTLTAG